MPRRGGICRVPGMFRRYESVVRTDEQPLANKQPLAKQQLSGKINSINEHLRDQKSLDTLFRRSVVASGLIANEQWEYCLRDGAGMCSKGSAAAPYYRGIADRIHARDSIAGQA